jgi:hypothetical protein
MRRQPRSGSRARGAAFFALVSLALTSPGGAEDFTLATYRDPCPAGQYCHTRGAAVAGERVFLVLYDQGRAGGGTWWVEGRLEVLDVSDPARPVEIGLLAPGRGTAFGDVAASPPLLLLASSGHPVVREVLAAAGVGASGTPAMLGELDLSRAIGSLVIRGDLALGALGFDGLGVFDVSDPSAPVQLAQVDADLLPGFSTEVYAVALVENTAYLSLQARSATEELLVLLVVDVSDPANPVVVGDYREPVVFGTRTIPAGVEVRDGIAYVSVRGGLRIIDVSDPASPGLLSIVRASPVYADQFTGIAVSGGTAYVANWELGLRAIDVSDPTSPVDLGFYPGDFDVPDSRATHVEVADGVAYVSLGNSGLQIIAVDPDGDDVTSLVDTCPYSFDPGQLDSDRDGVGDPCDVEIDLVPGNEANPVPIASAVPTPVAILGRATFDVASVDPNDLTFGPGGARPVAEPIAADVNSDGFGDLVAFVAPREMGIEPWHSEACLAGRLADGAPFESCDRVLPTTACGLGYELALLMPGIAWLRTLRRPRDGRRAGQLR